MKTFNFSNHIPFSWLAINTNASGDNIVVPAVAGKRVYVARLNFLVGGPCNLTFCDGTGTGTPFSGPLPMNAQGSGYTWDVSSVWWFVTTAGNGFNMNLDVQVTIGGTIWYSQF